MNKVFKKPIYRILNDFIKELRNNLINYYGKRLKCAVIFGSYAKGEITLSSDLDLFLVVTEPEGYRGKHRIAEFIREIETQIRSKYKLEISPWIRTYEEATLFHPLYLEIIENYVVLYDNGTWEKIKYSVQKEIINKKLAEKVKIKDTEVWRVKDEGIGKRLFETG